jgi:hypothetical protein
MSVIVGRIGELDAFLFQSRAVDSDRVLVNTERTLAVNLVGQLAISFCPGCGVRLDRFYSRSKDQLRRQDLVIGDFLNTDGER